MAIPRCHCEKQKLAGEYCECIADLYKALMAELDRAPSRIYEKIYTDPGFLDRPAAHIGNLLRSAKVQYAPGYSVFTSERAKRAWEKIEAAIAIRVVADETVPRGTMELRGKNTVRITGLVEYSEPPDYLSATRDVARKT